MKGDENLPSYTGIIINHEIRIPINQPVMALKPGGTRTTYETNMKSNTGYAMPFIYIRLLRLWDNYLDHFALPAKKIYTYSCARLS